MTVQKALDFGIVYSSGTNILAWHSGLDHPIVLAQRGGSINAPDYITALAFDEESRKLYDAGLAGVVRETVTSEPFGKRHSKTPSPVFGLDFLYDNRDHPERLVALTCENFDKSNPLKHILKLVYADNGRQITNISEQDTEKKLQYRPGSLQLKTNMKNRIHVASENIIEILRQGSQNKGINALTGRLCDSVKLAGNEINVYSISYSNDLTMSEGPELRTVPLHKRLAFWPVNKKWGGLNLRGGFGFPEMCTMFENILIFGARGAGALGRNNKIYSIKITPDLSDSDNGLGVFPTLLVENAFEIQGDGATKNSMVAMPVEDLKEFLKLSCP